MQCVARGSCDANVQRCAAWAARAQAWSREGADLAQTVYCTWPLMLLDRCSPPDVNKNGEASGCTMQRLTSVRYMGLFVQTSFCRFHRNLPAWQPARPMAFIWHTKGRHKQTRRLLLINTREKQVIMTLVSSIKRKPLDCVYAAAFCLHLLLWISCAVSEEEHHHHFNVEVR